MVDLLEGVGLPVVCVIGEFDGAQDFYILPAVSHCAMIDMMFAAHTQIHMFEESHVHRRADSIGFIGVKDDLTAIVALFQSRHNV